MTGRIDPNELKRRLPMLEFLAGQGVECRRAGALHVAHCPFHEERSQSFTIYTYPDASQDHAHCFGCGWNGDVIKYWRERHGVGFVDALHALASLASFSPSFSYAQKKQAAPVPRVSVVTRENKVKPALPRMRALTDAEVTTLAALRKLSRDGVAAAALDKRVGVCAWPQFEGCAVHGWECRRDRKDCCGNGHWHTPKDSALCWVVTDSERWVAQPRRFDGKPFVRRSGGEFKSWTIGSGTWPIGASEIGERAGVLLVEGGADMLAAYHFLAQFHRLHAVAVVAILGASCAICEEALPFFERKRVRIMMDEDEPKARKGKPEAAPIYPGREAAARWTEQLTNAGAAVETFSLHGLKKKDGTKVKDLNDLALVDEAAWLDEELRAAFFDFDF